MSTSTVSRAKKAVLWAFLALFLGAAIPAAAQPVLTFKRVINNWPTIELYFTVGCNGQPLYTLQPGNFKVFENGIEVGDFTLWCPDPRQRCAISVALVFDASGSMSGGGNAGAIQAGLNFVSNMDGVLDEASVVWFTENVTVAQTMTTSKTALQGAINSLPASGATACWDGVYEGLLQVIRSGTNPCRAVIALTDGDDNSSTRTPAEIISLATRNRIRVFTIGLGSFSGSIGDLQNIAVSTGGQFYPSPTSAQLTQIYDAISLILRQGFQECQIIYNAKCMDGGKRFVELQVQTGAPCAGKDSKTRQYTAPKDTSTYSDLWISLGRGEEKALKDVTIPLTLETPIDNENFYPVTFTITYDPACLSFKKLDVPSSSIIAGVPYSITPGTGTITVSTKDRKILNGAGLLMELTFNLKDQNRLDTVCCPVTITSWKFEQGCFRPKLKPGEICVFPLKPEVICNMNASSNDLQWDRTVKDYSPNPVTVTATFINNGDKDARNARYKLTYKKTDFSLAGPMTDIQTVSPRDVKMSGGQVEVRWDLMAKKRTTGDTSEVCIIASFDNHPDVKCCTKIFIPPTEPILKCDVSMPLIKADKVNQRYDPMPFEVTVNISNDGGRRADTVEATIFIDPDLSLAGADAPSRYTKKVANTMMPGGSATVTWELKHPITLIDKDYTVRVVVKARNADSTTCENTVRIPALDAPVLVPTCTVPDSLHFDEVLGAYTPNPFDVKVKVKNMGGLAADNVTCFLYLPPNVELVDPAEPLRKAFSPSRLDKWKVGMTEPELSWKVRYTKRLRMDTELQFRFVVGGMGETGIPTDSADTWCKVRVPGLAPAFMCWMSMPDSCGLNSTETDVTPNPFRVTYKIWNYSNMAAKITTATLFHSGNGLLFDPPNAPNPIQINQVLNPNDTVTVTWDIRVQNRITRRDNERFYVVAYDEDGVPAPICERYIDIANLKTSLICNVTTSEPTLFYRLVTQDYSPTTFVISADLTNTGGAAISNVAAKVVKDDPLDLVEFDPSYPDNDTTKTWLLIQPQGTKTATWGFRLKQPNLTDVGQFVNFDIQYKSKETPEVSGACTVPVEIEPVVLPKLVCELVTPDTIFFVGDRYMPSPFDVKVRVENLGTGDATNVKAFMLQNSRFNIVPPSYRDLPDIKAGGSVSFTANPGFVLESNPRATDGPDTVRVTVVADGIASYTCERIIFVKHEEKPVFQMACQATPNVLVFDDKLNDYVPNPFTVTTTVTNIGETRAEECQIVFVGPPRYTPADNSPIVNVGTLDVNGTFTFDWKVRPLCRENAGMDTLVYQILGKGGYKKRMVIGECRVPIFTPPCRAADYSILCEAPARLTYDNSNGVYIPDPFTFKATVTNTGLADGMGLEVTAVLPPGVIFDNSEVQTKPLPDLKVGQSSSVTWLLKPISRSTDGTVNIKAQVKDRFGKTKDCNSDVFIPRATNAAIELGCSGPDTLHVNRALGRYEDSENPFEVTLNIQNAGLRPADSVYAMILPQTKDLRIDGDPIKFVAARMDPSATAQVKWTLLAIPRTESGDVEVRFVVTAKSLASQECSHLIYIPEIGRPNLAPVASTVPADTLHFNVNEGDYEGEKSAFGKYNVFTVHATIDNIGAAQARDVTATILPPEGVTLEENETPIKNVDPFNLIVNASGKVSWKVRPLRDANGQLRRFTVQVASINAPTVNCVTDLFIQGAPKISVVSIPEDPVGRFGEKILVPIRIDETIGRDMFGYKFNIQFDPTAVRFLSTTTENTLTTLGWSGPKTRLYRTPGSTMDNVIRVEDFTTGSRLNSRTDGVLVYLIFEGIYGGPGQEMGYSQSDLKFLKSLTVDGKNLLSAINSVADDAEGEVTLVTQDGKVTVSGQCIVPLNSSGNFNLAQNKPNPFNPTTQIEYDLAEDGPVTLTIFNQLGREVRVLVKGEQKAGHYSVTFDGSGLPSGTYVYRLDTPKYSKSLRMVLAK